MRRSLLLLVAVSLFAGDPWTPKDLIQPEQASKALKSSLVIHVGFPVLYRSAHIPGT